MFKQLSNQGSAASYIISASKNKSTSLGFKVDFSKSIAIVATYYTACIVCKAHLVYPPAKGSGDMPPGKFLKFALLTLNLEALLTKNYKVVSEAHFRWLTTISTPHWTTPCAWSRGCGGCKFLTGITVFIL